MNLSQRCSNILLSLYKNINQTGLLNLPLIQSAFIRGYFTYKKHLEDPNAKLIKNYPELFRNGNILDIGANIGYTSYIFSNALTSTYKVFAFEPEKRNLTILKKSANTYNFLNKLVITAAAVGDKEGEIELWQNDGHHADHRVLTDELRQQLNGQIQIQKTPLISIDHFLQARNTKPISFIKIDVQGYELPVCRGMEQTLASNPDCCIEFEYCPSIMEALGYNPKELIQFFADKEYLFYRINKNGTINKLDLKGNTIVLPKDSPGYFDILCSKRKLVS